MLKVHSRSYWFDHIIQPRIDLSKIVRSCNMFTFYLISLQTSHMPGPASSNGRVSAFKSSNPRSNLRGGVFLYHKVRSFLSQNLFKNARHWFLRKQNPVEAKDDWMRCRCQLSHQAKGNIAWINWPYDVTYLEGGCMMSYIPYYATLLLHYTSNLWCHQ